eukprot:GHVQ01015976.1.p1 GENE.GHVQ01015976.1~~GHVQ01015976.1.p1  ORF type:complete len:294 (+),score=48.48 GHVQ01015976.1:545-1426(+)
MRQAPQVATDTRYCWWRWRKGASSDDSPPVEKLRLPQSLRSVGIASSIAYVSGNLLILLAVQPDTVVGACFWVLLHGVTVSFYFWVGYNPGYLLPSGGEGRRVEGERVDGVQGEGENGSVGEVGREVTVEGRDKVPGDITGYRNEYRGGGMDMFGYVVDDDEEAMYGDDGDDAQAEVVGKACMDQEDTEENWNSKREEGEEECYLKSYCDVCKVWQPLRTKHCRQCNHCVLTFDHHCFFIGGCVGEFNMWRFYTFLLLQSVTLLSDSLVVSTHVSVWSLRRGHCCIVDLHYSH